jgi:predicted phage terminase large subunit-like protein
MSSNKIPLGDLKLDVELLTQAIESAPASERANLIGLITELKRRQERELAQTNFLAFVKAVWPTFIYGRHHARMAQEFEKVVDGDNKRLIINLGPRHSKSELSSYLLPAWFLGKYPEKKVIQCSHTAELAVGFGRKVRNLVGSPAYQEIFPGVELQMDSKAAGRWNTSAGGSYFAIGVSGAVAGLGADILVIDDPHSEQEAAIAASNPDVYDKVYEWFTSGPRQRLQPGGAIIIVQTRWSKRDLTGQVRQKELEGGGDTWRTVELPAILPSGQPLWPEFWSLKELEATRNAISVSKWQAQYQQDPTSEEGALIKREWWQRWESGTPPPTDFIMQGWDTAFEKHNRADYSACITWGIFYHPDETGVSQANIIMLDAKRDRLEFPELKQQVLEEYKYWEPDCLLIEKKASGAPLIYELRAMGIAVSDFTPTRGNDKISRMNAVTDIFASGRVWAPNTRWADEVIEEVAAFPAGQHDDFCFVAGTKILMGDGSTKNIEDVCVGDKVWSHLGVKSVLASGCTGTTTTTTISDGINTLEGTASHLIYTDKGWKKLTEINRDDNILTVSTNKDLQCQQNKQEQIGQLSNSTTKLTKNTATDLIMSALVVGIFFIEMCGLFITEKSQATTIFIILMVILQIILLQIYNVCPRKSIVWSIEKIKALGVKVKTLWNTSLKLDHSQSHGTNLKKVVHGIGNMLKSFFAVKTGLLHIVKLYQWKKFALFVTNHSFQKIQTRKSIVQINVFLKPCDFVIKLINQLFTLIKNVSIVTKTFIPSIVTKDFAIAYAKTVSIEPNVKIKPVYNITVEGAETYYANNILVHNCDVVSMTMARFRKGGFISTTLDKQDEPEEFRGRSYGRSAYY